MPLVQGSRIGCGFGAAELVVAVVWQCCWGGRCTLFRGGRIRVRVKYGKWVGLRSDGSFDTVEIVTLIIKTTNNNNNNRCLRK